MLRLRIFNLLSFCLSIHELVKAATNMETIGLREKTGFQECVIGFQERIHVHCTYPGQEKPCLKDTEVCK